jgi:glycerol 3-phosphatase-2
MNTDIDAAWSFRRYQEILPRLPTAIFPTESQQAENLAELADQFDTFVFDAFGVLNVGEMTIPSAILRVSTLRDMGKQVRVLTNAASLPPLLAQNKFEKLGYDFTANEIIPSRQALIENLKERKFSGPCGCIAMAGAPLDDLPCDAVPFDATKDDYAAIIFLSSANWDLGKNSVLSEWMQNHKVPFLIGNPDLVAPRNDDFSMEPGAYAHDIADISAGDPEFFGKPFGNAFEAAVASLQSDIPRERILMVGDTLHTDILGGAAAEFKTCLVTGHGVLRDLDHHACIEESGIVPDFIVPTI